MIRNNDELSQARSAAVAQLNAYDCRILVCSGTGCIATGSNKIHEIFEKLVKETPGVELVFSPCLPANLSVSFPDENPKFLNSANGVSRSSTETLNSPVREIIPSV